MSTTLTLLGTGNPGCFPNVYQSAAAVVVEGTPFIIDCGGGTVQRLASACAAGQDALTLGKLKTLILTHLHPDHSAGLADFIISTWIVGRKEPLMIYGPAGTKKMTDLLIEALPEDRPIITTLSFIAAPVTFIPNVDGLTYVIER